MLFRDAPSKVLSAAHYPFAVFSCLPAITHHTLLKKFGEIAWLHEIDPKRLAISKATVVTGLQDGLFRDGIAENVQHALNR
jgi:hypothetical protein